MSGSEMILGVEGQDPREGCAAGKARKGGSRSRDVVLAFDARLAKIELVVAEMQDQMEDRLEEAFSTAKECKKEMREELNEEVRQLSEKNSTLEALVVAMLTEVEELKRKLSACENAIGGGILAMAPRARVDVPKPKEFKGTRSAKDVDNFLWGMEQYFRAMGIEEDATKVSTASMYLADIALLWWRRRYEDARRGGAAIGTWEVFQCEFKQQFYPEYAAKEARAKLPRLTQRGEVREYVREFSELMLQIPNLGGEEAFFSFMDGLRPWAKQELKRMIGWIPDGM